MHREALPHISTGFSPSEKGLSARPAIVRIGRKGRRVFSAAETSPRRSPGDRVPARRHQECNLVSSRQPVEAQGSGRSVRARRTPTVGRPSVPQHVVIWPRTMRWCRPLSCARFIADFDPPMWRPVAISRFSGQPSNVEISAKRVGLGSHCSILFAMRREDCLCVQMPPHSLSRDRNPTGGL
jgi:hypothetical protein